jgi:hypothetical protein
MAKGFGFVKSAAEKSQKSGGNTLWAGRLIFKLPSSGDEAIGRFVEVEDSFVHAAWHHEVPVEGRSWGDMVPCIAQDEDGERTDDPCPGCEADLPMKFKGYVLLIWRDAPVYKKDNEGKLVKDNEGDLVKTGDTADQIAIWSSGPRLFENLSEIEEAYGGLGSRDFRIKRKGTGTDTKYVILPADIDGGKKAMSKDDKALAADNDISLEEFVKPPSYDDFAQRLGGGGGSNGGSGSPEARAASTNPFKRS